MRDILADLEQWRKENKPVALATVVQTWGSSPRGAGSKMALTSDQQVTGSVSGGCVENAVLEVGLDIINTSLPQLLNFGVADEMAWNVGLACGGNIEVFVNKLDYSNFDFLSSALKEERGVKLITIIRGPQEILGREIMIINGGHISGSIGNDWDEKVLHAVDINTSNGKPHRIQIAEGVEIFTEIISPARKLIIVGGAHISIALSKLAKILGYKTIVIDPRKIWGNEGRFPEVDQLIQVWPEEAFQQIEITPSSAIAMLTHDPKLDDPALKIALSSSAFYVGALGSKVTNAKRRERLKRIGMPESQLSHLHAPIGMNIGSRTPEEIALAIMAEIVATYRKHNQLSIEHEADLQTTT